MVFRDVKGLSFAPIFIEEEDTFSGLGDHKWGKGIGIRRIIKTDQRNFQVDSAHQNIGIGLFVFHSSFLSHFYRERNFVGKHF
jgi:hypothetical protein